ncbi:MAG: hypothetical protein ACYTF8_18390, partial [Planctomycetota bacterium]
MLRDVAVLVLDREDRVAAVARPRDAVLVEAVGEMAGGRPVQRLLHAVVVVAVAAAAGLVDDPKVGRVD